MDDKIMHVVSMSGGKDSCATAILALETQPREQLRFVFADTGNEHEITLEYLPYVERTLGIKIDTIRADFTADMERKRRYILEKWALKGVPADAVERAAAAMVPTGNPYLDLCTMKGRFPSTKSAFCTTELKTLPLMEYQMGFIERGEAQAVWSWQGVRVNESQSRRRRLACPVHPSFHKSFEVVGGGVFNYRPILRWEAADCFEAHRIAGLKPNPLYSMGMGRVGCMPCINAGKDELLEISKRFPEHVDRIERWESHVALASKREESSFFPDPDRGAHLNKRGIRNMVEWSKTGRGGQMVDFIRVMEEPKECASAYGLCE